MARIARVVVPDYPHHITQRGVRSMNVFWTKEDRKDYLHFLLQQGSRFGVKYVAWCLMTNHVHLVAVPEKPTSLARGIGEGHRRYTRGINFRQGVRGYLFQGRFWSCVLDEAHLIATIRYIERNPVRAQMVDYAWDYEWSSARFRVGNRDEDPLVEDRNPYGIVLEWRELLQQDPKETEFIREQSRTGRPCGEEGFLEKIERLTGRRLRPSPRGPRR